MHYERDCNACDGKGYLVNSSSISSGTSFAADSGYKLVSELKRLVHACDMEKAAKRFADLGMYCSTTSLKDAIDCSPHSSTKMAIIRAVAPHVFGDPEIVVDALTHATDKRKARELLR